MEISVKMQETGFHNSQITHQRNALDFHFIADINNGCKANVDYEPPEDGLVKVETYVGVEE